LADTYFSCNDFNRGATYLEKAVSLDKRYSKCWENLVDALYTAKKYEDALLAYEQCFIATPSNLDALKKIGDCYLETGQLEAAKEAYQQLKSAIKKEKD